MPTGIDWISEENWAREVTKKKKTQEPQVYDEAVVPYKKFGWLYCSHLWSQEPTMVMGLDWTDVASSSGWVELIKP